MIEFKISKSDDLRIIKNLSGDHNFGEFVRILDENRAELQKRSEVQRGEDLYNTQGALQFLRSLIDTIDNIDTIITDSDHRRTEVAKKVKAATHIL